MTLDLHRRAEEMAIDDIWFVWNIRHELLAVAKEARNSIIVTGVATVELNDALAAYEAALARATSAMSYKPLSDAALARQAAAIHPSDNGYRGESLLLEQARRANALAEVAQRLLASSKLSDHALLTQALAAYRGET